MPTKEFLQNKVALALRSVESLEITLEAAVSGHADLIDVKGIEAQLMAARSKLARAQKRYLACCANGRGAR